MSRNRLFRNGLKSLLGDSNVELVQELEYLADASASPTGLTGHEPITLLDSAANQAGILEDIRSFTRLGCGPLVVLADAWETRSLVDCMGAGAKGYLLKDISVDALLHSLRLVLLGEMVFPTVMVTQLLNDVRNPIGAPQVSSALRLLSSRERQILGFLLDGASNKTIGRHLQITEATVKVHMKSLMRKIDCTNRTQAAIWAFKHGEPSGRADDDVVSSTIPARVAANA